MTKPNNNEQHYTDRAYRLVPQMIVNFAERARLIKGFRLVQRCIRRGFHPQTCSILFADGNVVIYNDLPCLMVHH
jgi:hypothetical protein